MMGGGKPAAPDLCQAIPTPAPLAKRIDMSIIEGDLIACDEGCVELIKQYAATREALGAACAK